jgi:anti-sigma regulatory factor (Ser/Thr protein kinase)/putative methionine-R-sulfoxide reductase with GAF domain
VAADDVPAASAPGEGQVLLGTGLAPDRQPGLDQLGHLYRLGDPALSDLELDPLLDELLSRALDILAVDTAAILLLDPATDELVARAARGIEEEVEQGVRIPLGRGFAGRIAASRSPIFIADVDHAEILNPILREKGIRSLLGVPLLTEGGVLGVLHVGSLTPREFTDQDAVVLQLAAARAAPALEREHNAAVGLQRSLLPHRLPSIVGAPVAARYLPARDEVGGDWYDVMPLHRGLVGVAIGDVSGHGIRAAALMGEIRAALRAYAYEGHSASDVLQRLDRLIGATRERGMATAAYGIFDPDTGSFRYSLAGHPPPLVVSAEGKARLLASEPPAPPLGSVPYAGYNDHETTLVGGDILLLYTDGLIERRGERLRDGFARLASAAAGAATAAGLCDQLARELLPDGGAADDVAMVALQNERVPERLSLQFPAQPAILREVRRALRRWLHEIGAGPEDVATLTLAAGEACANAIEHAYAPMPSAFAIESEENDRVVTMIVRDSGRWRRPRGTNRGRGLTIIEAAVDEFDVRQTDAGTEVVMRRRLRDAA